MESIAKLKTVVFHDLAEGFDYYSFFFWGEDRSVCVFRSVAGEEFSATRPKISEEDEAALVAELREILRDEGTLGKD